MTWSFQKVHEHLINLMHVTIHDKGRHQDTFPRVNFTTACTIIGGLTYLDLDNKLNVSITAEDNKCVVVMEMES